MKILSAVIVFAIVCLPKLLADHPTASLTRYFERDQVLTVDPRIADVVGPLRLTIRLNAREVAPGLIQNQVGALFVVFHTLTLHHHDDECKGKMLGLILGVLGNRYRC